MSDISQPTATAPSNINVDGPPAYITWKTPLPNTAYPPLYKIGASTVTMVWEIDHEALQVPPTNITVAIVSPQKETFIADVLPGSATSAAWDLVNMTRPLMVGHFTVSIYDQRGPTAIPSPGQLMPDSRLILALYNTETYVALTDGKMASHALLASQARTSSVLTFFFFVGVSGSQILSNVFLELWISHGLSGIFHCDWDQCVHSDFVFRIHVNI